MSYLSPELINDISFGLAFIAATLFFLVVMIVNRKLIIERAHHSSDSVEVLNQRKWLTLFLLSFAIVLLFSPRIASLNISAEGVGFTTNVQNIADTATDTAEKWTQEKKKNQQLLDKLSKAQLQLEQYQQRFTLIAKEAEKEAAKEKATTSTHKVLEDIVKATVASALPVSDVLPEKSYDVLFSGIEVINKCEFYNSTGEFFWNLKINDELSSERMMVNALKAKKNQFIELTDGSSVIQGTEDDYFVVSGGVFERDRKKYNTVGILSEVISLKEVAQQLHAQKIYRKAFQLRKDSRCEVKVHLSISEKLKA